MSFTVFDTRVANLPASLQWQDNSASSTNSTTPVLVPGILGKALPEGRWMVIVSIECDGSVAGAISFFEFFKGGVLVPGAQRRQGNRWGTASLILLDDFNGTDVLELYYRSTNSSRTITLGQRNACAFPLGR